MSSAFGLASFLVAMTHALENWRIFHTDNDPELERVGDAILAAVTDLDQRPIDGFTTNQLIGAVVSEYLGEIFPVDSQEPVKDIDLNKLAQLLTKKLNADVTARRLPYQKAQRVAQVLTGWIGHSVTITERKSVVIVARIIDLPNVKKALENLPLTLDDIHIVVDEAELVAVKQGLVAPGRRQVEFVSVKNLFQGDVLFSQNGIGQVLRNMISRDDNRKRLLVFSKEISFESHQFSGLTTEQLSQFEFVGLEELINGVLSVVRIIPLGNLLDIAYRISYNA
jgi:hypothetical protein